MASGSIKSFSDKFQLPWNYSNTLKMVISGKNPSCTTAEICDNPRQFVIPAQLVIPKGSKQ
jgi:hypothetical protein